MRLAQTNNMATLISKVIDIVVADCLFADHLMHTQHTHDDVASRASIAASNNDLCMSTNFEEATAAAAAAATAHMQQHQHQHNRTTTPPICESADFRGQGSARKYPTDTGPTTMATEQSRSNEVVQPQITLVGFSYGGMVAQHIASQRQDVCGIIFVSSMLGVWQSLGHGFLELFRFFVICIKCLPFLCLSRSRRLAQDVPHDVASTRTQDETEPSIHRLSEIWLVMGPVVWSGAMRLAWLAASRLIYPWRCASDLNELWIAGVGS